MLSRHLSARRSALTGSNKVFRSDLGQERNSLANELAVHAVHIVLGFVEPNGSDAREVVGASTLVEEGHLAISLEVGKVVSDDRLVDRELLVVYADSVSVGIWVREQSRLKDRVGGRLDTGNHVGRVESGLLDLGKVVLSSADVFSGTTGMGTRTLAFWFKVNFPMVRRGYSL